MPASAIRRSRRIKKKMDMEGDQDHEYNDGECVWAKYADYPWWPGQIELPPKKKRGNKPKHQTITVRWFGDFGGVQTNAVQKRFVTPWDPDEMDRVYVEVDDEDITCFQESVDECNTVYMQCCEEQGFEPLESAIDYDRKDGYHDSDAPRALEYNHGEIKICAHKRELRDGCYRFYYNVKWLHNPDKTIKTWEPAAHMPPEMLNEYWTDLSGTGPVKQRQLPAKQLMPELETVSDASDGDDDKQKKNRAKIKHTNTKQHTKPVIWLLSDDSDVDIDAIDRLLNRKKKKHTKKQRLLDSDDVIDLVSSDDAEYNHGGQVQKKDDNDCDDALHDDALSDDKKAADMTTTTTTTSSAPSVSSESLSRERRTTDQTNIASVAKVAKTQSVSPEHVRDRKDAHQNRTRIKQERDHREDVNMSMNTNVNVHIKSESQSHATHASHASIKRLKLSKQLHDSSSSEPATSSSSETAFMSSAESKDSQQLFLAQQAQRYPQLAAHYEKLEELYSKKFTMRHSRLYPQLTKALHQFIFNDESFVADNMIMLYLHFIAKIQRSLNSIELSRLIVRCSKQFVSLEDALKFLDAICIQGKDSKSQNNKDGGGGSTACMFARGSVPWMILQCEIGSLYLCGDLVPQCKQIMDEIIDMLERSQQPCSVLYSQYHRVCLQYYKTMGAPQQYVDHSLKFLTHTKAQDLPKPEQMLFGSDICLAALLSEQCYDFSILLSQDLIQSLQRTEFDWLYQMICIFNTGDLIAWITYCLRHEERLKTHETIRSSLAFLEQKIRLMALVELVFQTPAHERCISFETIRSQCKLQMDEVEFILIRAMSLQLVRGIIDEIDKTVTISYCVHDTPINSIATTTTLAPLSSHSNDNVANTSAAIPVMPRTHTSSVVPQKRLHGVEEEANAATTFPFAPQQNTTTTLEQRNQPPPVKKRKLDIDTDQACEALCELPY